MRNWQSDLISTTPLTLDIKECRLSHGYVGTEYFFLRFIYDLNSRTDLTLKYKYSNGV